MSYTAKAMLELRAVHGKRESVLQFGRNLSSPTPSSNRQSKDFGAISSPAPTPSAPSTRHSSIAYEESASSRSSSVCEPMPVLREVAATPGTMVALLQSPHATAGWTVLKEGYLKLRDLNKTSLRGLLGGKLYWFVLKQNPVTLDTQLECYKGRVFKAGMAVRQACIAPNPDGSFVLRNADENLAWHLSDESTAEESGICDPEKSKWVVAVQLAVTAGQRAKAMTRESVRKHRSKSDGMYGHSPSRV